jgi:alkaline phosphatase
MVCAHLCFKDCLLTTSAIGVNPAVEPVGSILETAKLAGFKTGLVVTSTINHATPAVYAAHVEHRDSYEAIAAQEIGYSHPLGPMVDILLGGGRCYFKPQSDETSCRHDDLDLFGFAEEKGYRVMQDRAAFDELELGHAADATLPYIGLFNDDQMQYEIDRRLTPEEEPSLLEMAKTALTTLDKAVAKSQKGYFIMIEASRIDHAGHANDAAAHLHETIMYNSVMDYVQEWIDAHPDTMMMSAADHECGGLTLNGFNPLPLGDVEHSFEYYQFLWEDELNGTIPVQDFIVDTVLPGVGLTNVTEDELAELFELEDEEEIFAALTEMQADLAGVNWSTGGHTASDINLHAYGAGKKSDEVKVAMAGNHDNHELPLYIEKVLGLNLQSTTDLLRQNGVDWVPREDELKKRSLGGHHAHSH